MLCADLELSSKATAGGFLEGHTGRRAEWSQDEDTRCTFDAYFIHRIAVIMSCILHAIIIPAQLKFVGQPLELARRFRGTDNIGSIGHGRQVDENILGEAGGW